MQALRFLGILWALFVLAGCTSATKVPPREHAPLLLISFDGFRWDYLQRYAAETPHFQELARNGVVAEGLIPVFPTNTFPNHYAIVTGLYPSHSGMINNRMTDTQLGAKFVYKEQASSRDSRWWGGEPIWITAVKQGRPSACYFWPGSEAEIKGTRATFWKPYDYSIPFENRLDELVSWLKLPPGQRPAIVTFYFEEANSIGHTFGPESTEMAKALRMMDAQLAALTGRLAAERIEANFVLVSDHGMAPLDSKRTVIIDDYINVNDVDIEFDGTVAGLRPKPGADVRAIRAALARMPHMKVYRSADLPRRLRIDPNSPRVPPIWIMPDEGATVLQRSVFRTLTNRFLRGEHGYDPTYKSMHGLFVASGPAFRRGVVIPPVENVHVYPLLCAATGLMPAANDGDDRLVKAALR